jgi:hypothetical protein
MTSVQMAIVAVVYTFTDRGSGALTFFLRAGNLLAVGTCRVGAFVLPGVGLSALECRRPWDRRWRHEPAGVRSEPAWVAVGGGTGRAEYPSGIVVPFRRLITVMG